MTIRLRCTECGGQFNAPHADEKTVSVESPCCGVEVDVPPEVELLVRGEETAPRLEGF